MASQLLTQFTKLTVGNDKSAQGSQAIEGLIPVLLGGTFVDGGTRKLGVGASHMLRLPYEILKKIALVLGQDQDLGLFDDFAKVANNLSAFR